MDLMPNLKEKIAKWNLQRGVGHAAPVGRQVLPAPRRPPEALGGLHDGGPFGHPREAQARHPGDLGRACTTVLKAMKADTPTRYPLSDRWGKPHPGGKLLNIVGAAYGPRRLGLQGRHLGPERPEVRLHRRHEPYKQMLQYLNKLVKEKLLDPESFTQADDAGAPEAVPASPS